MNEAAYTLYAFVEGFDLDEVASHIEGELRGMVAAGDWRWKEPAVVNERHPRTLESKPDDLPPWELGVTIALPDPGKEPVGWFVDVERTILFMAALHKQTGRDFVVGILDTKRGYSEDLFTVDSESPNLEELREIVGMGDAS
jgi:hypothetical protein